MTDQTMPPQIHEAMMRNNPQYRKRVERRQKAQKRGRTLPPGALPKTTHTVEN